MDMKLELIPLTVADPEASLDFYANKVGFNLDHDVSPGNGMRIIQLTPPGSSCSIAFGSGMGGPDNAHPVRNLHIVVRDIDVARSQLVQRGVEISAIENMGGVKYAYFADPDGNSWALQHIPEYR